MAGTARSRLAPTLAGGELLGRAQHVRMADVDRHSVLNGRRMELATRSVLLLLRDPFLAGVVLDELNGVVRRMVLCPPDIAESQLPELVETCTVEAVVTDTDQGMAFAQSRGLPLAVRAAPDLDRQQDHGDQTPETPLETEWVLLTSATTGAPKPVLHTLRSLTGGIRFHRDSPPSETTLWATFYDIRRYGGLQIYLRAMLGGVPLVIPDPDEAPRAFLRRAGEAGVTHMTGTPSHWRRALMSGAIRHISPRYLRLSGEIADQAILDQLRAVFPDARVVHAFASTEAGLAFEVDDGLAGFPAHLLERPPPGVELKVEDGTLCIRGPGNAVRYLGEAAGPLKRSDGFVDTGDQIELRDGRFYFLGRRGGVINVGGFKVFPEEVESVLNSLPPVRMARVHARRNPITGAVVAADIVLREDGEFAASAPEIATREILNACRERLPAHKVPAAIRIVPAIEVAGSGKMSRA